MEIKEYLESLGIKFITHEHPAVYTVKEAENYFSNIKGIHSKNLFLKERKSKRFYMVIIPFNKNLDLIYFEGVTGDKLKFANQDNLKEILNVSPGSVSPFNLINDSEKKTELIIDKEVWESEFAAFHPNINTETLELKRDDFHKFVNSLGIKVSIS
ncbi:prolyl-tRNA synthetase associated domain-containing protein [Candidatus Pacearchaeota archaeon]|nr:prolyl-tRNA synthetase associated domain-containing protein [Candidatus Pacearchaeota archaeon]